VTEVSAYKYNIFITCSAADKAWGEWLQAVLEDFSLCNQFIPPGKFQPVFGDCDSRSPLPSSPTLAALKQSKFLLVLCSPGAAKSLYIQYEIRRFKLLGRLDRVIPVLLPGTCNHAPLDCIPPDLRGNLGPVLPQGYLRLHPTRAEIRLGEDGKAIPIRRLMPEVLGLRGEATSRWSIEACRRGEITRRTVAAGLLAFTLAFSCEWGLVLTQQGPSSNEHLLNPPTVQESAFTRAAASLSHFVGIPQDLPFRILAAGEDVFRTLASVAPDVPQLSDPEGDQGANLLEAGDANASQGRFDEALENYDRSLAIAQQMAADEPENPLWQEAVMLSHARIGDVLRVQGRLEEALESYFASHAIARSLVAADAGSVVGRRGLMTVYFGVGEVHAAQDKLDEALASYRASNAEADRLLANDPGDAEWQRGLAVSHNRIASILETRGEFEVSLVEYRSALTMVRYLLARDPDNLMWRRSLGLAHGHVGDVLLALGDLAGALKAYEKERAIVGPLAAADGTNRAWQHDVALNHARMGFALEALQDFAAAASEHEAHLAIAIRFAAADPGSASAQYELALSYGKLAHVYHLLGRSRQALVGLRHGRNIVATLASSDRLDKNRLWNDDLVLFDRRIAALEGRSDRAPIPSATFISTTGASVTVPSDD
jgi:tetratricopeptide (TPR) repeat protein